MFEGDNHAVLDILQREFILFKSCFELLYSVEKPLRSNGVNYSSLYILK